MTNTGAFSPEIINAIQFAEQSEVSANLLSQFAKVGAGQKTSLAFTESRFQTNLLYIERQFEEAFRSLKLGQDQVLFVDGIDIRPGSIPYDKYLECIKGLANAVWSANNDFLSGIKDSKGRLRVVLLVRPDIFDKLGLQNQNSKLRDNSVILDWLTTYRDHRSSGLFQISDRVLSFQQKPPGRVGEAWDHYFPFDAPNVKSTFTTPSSFIAVLRLSLYRPRDIHGMLAILKDNFVAAKRSPSEVFRLTDLRDARFTRAYSDYLLGEVKDHLSFYHPAEEWEQFLKFFQYLSGHSTFSYDEYLAAFREFDAYLDRNGHPKPSFATTPDTFLQFLFDLAVLCYVAESEDERFFGWCFRERTPTNLAPKVRTGVTYEIHTGIRKALDIGKTLS